MAPIICSMISPEQNPCSAYLSKRPGDLSNNWRCLQNVYCRHNTITPHFPFLQGDHVPCSDNLLGLPIFFLEEWFLRGQMYYSVLCFERLGGLFFSDNTFPKYFLNECCSRFSSILGPRECRRLIESS